MSFWPGGNSSEVKIDRRSPTYRKLFFLIVLDCSPVSQWRGYRIYMPKWPGYKCVNCWRDAPDPWPYWPLKYVPHGEKDWWGTKMDLLSRNQIRPLERTVHVMYHMIHPWWRSLTLLAIPLWRLRPQRTILVSFWITNKTKLDYRNVKIIWIISTI